MNPLMRCLMSMRLIFRMVILSITVFALIDATTVALGADWPQWRGPNRKDITPESSGWPDSWPPKRIWSKNVGRGCTSPIIVDGRLYVMGWQGEGNLRENPIGTDTVYCFNALTGEELWKQTYSCRYQSRVRTGDEGAYGGPSSTPAFDPQTGYLYTLSIDGDLRCWNTKQKGQLVWPKNFYDEYNIPQRPPPSSPSPHAGREGVGGQRDYGFTSSPLIQGDLVIVEVGDNEGTVMAFNKRTGQRQWRSTCNEPAGHTSGPVSLTVQGISCLANLTLRKLVVMRTDKGHEGQTMAEYDWQTDYANNIATPAVFDNQIVLTSSQNVSSTCLVEVSLNGVREKWRTREHSQVSSPVIYKGCIYLADGSFKCLDFETGQLKWKGGNFDHGSCLITAGDDKVIAFGRGKLVLIEAFPADNQYHELSSVKEIVPDVCYPHVVLSDGIICCKDKAGNMVCFSLR
ncbi:hypothetical protein FJZ31_15975 [Candidatus Poribacteria bacterium]|nr:hypothetical protein [Candidatus Poribacteria bacterium]